MRLFFRFLNTYARPYWKWYLLGLVALYGSNQLTVLVPVFIKESIDALTVGDGDTSLNRVGLIAVAAIGIMVIRSLSRACFFNPGRAAEFRLKNHLFRHLTELPQSFHDASRVGDLMSRSTNDLQNVRALIGFAGLQIVEGAFILPMTLHQMLKLDRDLTLSNAGLLFIAMLVLFGSAQVVVRLMRQGLEQLSQLSDHILDTYSAIPVVHGFVAWPAFLKRFDEQNDAYIRNGLRVSALRSFVMPVVNVIGQVCIGMVLWQGGNDVLEGRLTVGALVAYSGFIGILVSKMMSLGWTLSVIQRGIVALRRVYELLDIPQGLPETRLVLPAPIPTPDGRAQGYGLELRNLTFTYPQAGERGATLKDISFRLQPGETLGIFGGTGSGKSTLMHLLARIYTPPPGTIFLNGVDINDIPLESLRSLFALVPQDPFLFSTTLRENIAWSDESPHHPDPVRLDRAIRLACLESDVHALSQGLDTIVGARGVTLSGGQRQRTALARVFYADFQILLLDDVLAAVDHRTERQLIENIYSIAEEKKGKAQLTLIISHRISALQHADRIIVLENGALIASGTHAELLAQGGLYAECWKSQQEKEENP